MTEKVKITTKRYTATDGGQHGSATCGECGAAVKDEDAKCPSCDALFGQSAFEPYPFGGSDFP